MAEDPSIIDNEVLDQWRIPFGDWYDQAVDWVDNTFDGVLKGIESTFDVLIDLVNDKILLGVPWLVVIIAFFVLGWVLQNIRVGVFSAIALTICALMGNQYWEETARTIGFIFVAVLLCTVIGIPIGIAAGRMDGFWKAVRPVLDAMQVVHSFIYMLPFIYFFGIGEVSATIVTMVFALPPLIRLTNLGIRQVPEDVVEASRAFGQTELAILRDVQLPLARPAIMTGINQTLLLSISMLGIAALMGAGGLAQFMFRALSNQDPALSGSAGLSFFLVAVVLDRLTQRDGDNTRSLGARMRRAWGNRATPENLIDITDDAGTDPVEDINRVIFEPVTARERIGMAVSAIGSIVVLASLFLTWNSNGGWFTSFSRRADELGEELTGQAFNGLEASGASWFGYALVLLALVTIAAAVSVLMKPGQTSRWLNADGAIVTSVATLALTATYLLSKPSAASVAESGIGPVVALIGAIAMTAGAGMWILAARHEPQRPLSSFTPAPIVYAAIAVLFLIGAGFANFTSDERSEAVIGPELQEQLDTLEAEARDPETSQRRALAIINQMTSLRASAVNSGTITIDGFTGDGSTIARWTLATGLLGLAGAVLASGAAFADQRKRWIAGSVAMGAGAGILAVAVGWIGTLARATDPPVVSGVGVFFLLLAGAALANAGRSVVNEFRRSRVYPELGDKELADLMDHLVKPASMSDDLTVAGAGVS